jgi:hypothetical protein
MANEPGANGSAHQNLLPGVPLVTFGMECELVLAFHESLLIPYTAYRAGRAHSYQGLNSLAAKGTQ